MRRLSSQKGFTLIELLVIVGVLGLLLGLTLVYTNSGARQIILFREQARLVSELMKAKGNTLERVQGEDKICGYGLALQTDGYILYKDLPDGSNNCTDYKYSGTDEALETIMVDPNISIAASGAQDILFAPPDPTVYFDGGVASGETDITLTIRDGNSVHVIMNQGGQVVTQ